MRFVSMTAVAFWSLSLSLTIQAGAQISGRPAGLIQSANSKTRCLDAELGTTIGSMNFECYSVYNLADPGWEDWDDPWFTHNGQQWSSWVESSPSTRQVVLAENLIPNSLGKINDPMTWERPCAEGLYDSYAVTLANNLVASGFGYSVIRLGPEMNGPWETDFVGRSVLEQRYWARCFAQEVNSMRTVSGAHFLFDWDINACVNPYPLRNYYPGSAYVDIIGVDVYDSFCNGLKPTPSQQTTRALFAEPLGLDTISRFAAKVAKPMSLPEWGTVAASSGGLSDDPFYVDGIGRYIARHDVAFETYYDVGDGGIYPLTSEQAPRTYDAYLSEIG